MYFPNKAQNISTSMQAFRIKYKRKKLFKNSFTKLIKLFVFSFRILIF